MGIHFVNPDLLADGVSKAHEPEALPHEPTTDSGYELVGVEYVIPASLTTDTPPVVKGLGVEMHGPSDVGQGPQYDLHAWVWRENPEGMFAPFNPTVSYPEGSGGHDEGGHHE